MDKSVYKKPYQPLMLTTSQYGSLDYGTKYFRDQTKEQELPGGVYIFLKSILLFLKTN